MEALLNSSWGGGKMKFSHPQQRLGRISCFSSSPAVFSDLCFLTSPLSFFPHSLFFKTCPSVPRAIQLLPSVSTPTQGFSSVPCVPPLAADWPQACSLPGQIIGRENRIFLSFVSPTFVEFLVYTTLYLI